MINRLSFIYFFIRIFLSVLFLQSVSAHDGRVDFESLIEFFGGVSRKRVLIMHESVLLSNWHVYCLCTYTTQASHFFCKQHSVAPNTRPDEWNKKKKILFFCFKSKDPFDVKRWKKNNKNFHWANIIHSFMRLVKRWDKGQSHWTGNNESVKLVSNWKYFEKIQKKKSYRLISILFCSVEH